MQAYSSHATTSSFIVQSGGHDASPIGGRKSAYTLHPLKTFLAAVGPQNAKFLTAITFELSSIDPGYMSYARDVMDQHRRIVVLFKQLESLAIANPKWQLEASMTLSIKTHVDHTMLYKDARCLVNLPDSGGSLRIFRSSLEGDLGKTFGSQWNKEELQWAVKAVQRWEEMLTKRA